MTSKTKLPFLSYILDSTEASKNILRDTMSDKNSNLILLCVNGYLTVENEEHMFNVAERSLLVHTSMKRFHLLKISDDFEGMFMTSQNHHGMLLINRVLDAPTQISIINNPILKMNKPTFEQFRKKVVEIIKIQNVYEEPNIGWHNDEILNHLIVSMAVTLAYSVCYLFSVRMEKPSESIDHRDTIVMMFLKSLNKNYINQRSVKCYAEEQSLQSSYFSSIVKSKTGRTANKWIEEFVINGAKEMLIWQDVSIKEIAFKLHFPSQSFFGKYFKKRVGMSPKEFRMLKHVKNGG
jgi:AraC-like DNA-binding protein